MTCRNTDLIFDLRREITDLTSENTGLKTAVAEQAAIASAEIHRLQERIAERERTLGNIETRLTALVDRLERAAREGRVQQ